MGSEQLQEFAVACRRGLETLAGRRGSMFQGFPKAACGPASELVGRLLKERLGLEGFYVCGDDHPGLLEHQTHAWFEVGDHIIDITYDQFAGVRLEGWLLPATSSWHMAFRCIERRPGYCVPSGWPMYPFDGYGAMERVLDCQGHHWAGQERTC